jgi:murein DD-endopeptidase MepM/ murein hydrolase activator NlpD
MNQQTKLHFFKEVLGLSPFKLRLKQAAIALRGEQDVPKSSFNLSSLKQLHPKISPRLWRGKPVLQRKVIISNLYNHKQTPIEEGWSLAMTQTLDFRGKSLTYNSHNGTDFSIPVGSRVLSAAPGVVVAIMSEFNRGGLKIFIDHGDGLMTCYAHLARSLVQVGQQLKGGQLIALSGYSGLDGFITFPWGIPHVHFNCWLNGEPIDPFAREGEVSMWLHGNEPRPAEQEDQQMTASAFQLEAVDRVIQSCLTSKVRDQLMAIADPYLKACHTIIQMNYYPTRFPKRENLYLQHYPRRSALSLPFSKQDFDGVVFLDELPNNFATKQINL